MPGSNGKRMVRRTLWVFASLLLLAVRLSAEQLPIKTYTTADGLVSNRISRIVRDARGYLWFCTEDGLSRFDGYSFTNYTMQQGLPSNWVDDFLETSGGVFLVGTSEGLCVFDPEGEPLAQDRLAEQANARPMFTAWRPGDARSVAGVKVLYEDSLARIWCGTVDGLYRVEVADRHITVHEIDLGIPRNGLGLRRVRSLAEDGNGALWVLTLGELLRYTPDQAVERMPLQKDFSGASLMSLVREHQGTLWVSSRQGL